MRFGLHLKLMRRRGVQGGLDEREKMALNAGTFLSEAQKVAFRDRGPRRGGGATESSRGECFVLCPRVFPFLAWFESGLRRVCFFLLFSFLSFFGVFLRFPSPLLRFALLAS